jgi:hypothetical protein
MASENKGFSFGFIINFVFIYVLIVVNYILVRYEINNVTLLHLLKNFNYFCPFLLNGKFGLLPNGG